MAVRTPPIWLQAGSHPAENCRLMLGSLVPAEGVVGIGDLQAAPKATPNMSVDIAIGAAFVKNDLATNGGTYHAFNDALTNLTVTPSDPTNPRKDLVVLRIRDSVYAGGSNDAALVVLAGTPAASPAEPTIPLDGSYLVLALVDVPAGATQIQSGQITDRRPRAAVPANNALPVGAMVEFAAAGAPAGWLPCDGAAVARNAYASLFAAIGTVWGTGDGSTTFNVPDTRGKVLVGTGQGPGLTNRALGSSGGAETHTLAASEMPAHGHTVNNHSHGGATTGGPNLSHQHAFTTDPNGNHTHDVEASAGAFHVAYRYASANGKLSTTGNAEGITFSDIDLAGNHTHTGGTDFRLGAHEHTIPAESPGTNNAGGGGAHNNMQPWAGATRIIKAF